MPSDWALAQAVAWLGESRSKRLSGRREVDSLADRFDSARAHAYAHIAELEARVFDAERSRDDAIGRCVAAQAARDEMHDARFAEARQVDALKAKLAQLMEASREAVYLAEDELRRLNGEGGSPIRIPDGSGGYLGLKKQGLQRFLAALATVKPK
ncbi:MAG: hypothetical protein A2Y61_05335 [Chloroflexi bacterium RBG_13_60_13]|nr:MAG: hypothetical protein A2Y61_05335 [Chloroflexi bacterium RBG_13_60_13]